MNQDFQDSWRQIIFMQKVKANMTSNCPLMHIFFLQVLDGLKSGNEALKKANEMFSIEEIEQIMEDTAEAIDKQKEIDALLSGQLTDQDEDEVQAELDQLIESAEEDPVVLPDVPQAGNHYYLCLKEMHQQDQRASCFCVPWV